MGKEEVKKEETKNVPAKTVAEEKGIQALTPEEKEELALLEKMCQSKNQARHPSPRQMGRLAELRKRAKA